MPRFYFHLYDDTVVLDEEGQELPDADTAAAWAKRSARELLCEGLRAGSLDLRHRIEVKDEAGETVHLLMFRDAVSIRSRTPAPWNSGRGSRFHQRKS